MSNRACLSCGLVLSRLIKGRCRECAKEKAADKPNPYSNSREWKAMSKRMRAEQPWCSRCATQGSPSNPLTLDHLVPLAIGGALVPDDDALVQVLCRKCQGIEGGKQHGAGRWRA